MPARSAASAQPWSKTNSPWLFVLRYRGHAPTRRSPSQTVRGCGCDPVCPPTQPESSSEASHAHSRKGESAPTKASHAAGSRSDSPFLMASCTAQDRIQESQTCCNRGERVGECAGRREYTLTRLLVHCSTPSSSTSK